MKWECSKCGKEFTENWVYEPGLGQICQNCYKNHVFGEGYDLEDKHVNRSSNTQDMSNLSLVRMRLRTRV